MPRSKSPAKATGTDVSLVVGLGAAAYDRLKRAIVECELPPGSVISQPQLEERYGLSRAAIRAALSRLQQERLVEPIPRHGYRIPPFTVQDIEEIFFLRGLVEPVSNRLAAGRMSRDALEELRVLSEVSFTLGDRDSERAYVDANRTFHLRIAEASGNGRLLSLIRQIHDDSTLMVYLTMAFRDFNAEWKLGHEQIILALAAGDGVAAEHHSRAEIAAGRESVVRTLLSHPGISSLNLSPSKSKS